MEKPLEDPALLVSPLPEDYVNISPESSSPVPTSESSPINEQSIAEVPMKPIIDTEMYKEDILANDLDTAKSTTEPPKPIGNTSGWFSKSNEKDLNEVKEPKYILRIPGIANIPIANPKRNAEFHAQFPDVPVNDRLLEDFTCAWANDSLLQGRMYFTDNHIFFHAKVIWKYTLLIHYTDIITFEKKSVAGIFKNALEIETADKKYFFSGFLYRNQAFELLEKILLGYPNYKIEQVLSSPGTESDQISVVDIETSPSINARDSSDSQAPPAFPKRKSISQPIIDLTENSDHPIKLLTPTVVANATGAIVGEKKRSISGSALDEEGKGPIGLANIVNESSAVPKREGTPGIVHQKHVVNPPDSESLSVKTKVKAAPFLCTCIPLHKEQNQSLDTVFELPLQEIWLLLYGNESEFCEKFWKVLKYTDCHATPWLEPPVNLTDGDYDKKADMPALETLKPGYNRRLKYIVPVNNPMGPKETQCFATETIKNISSYQVCIESVTQTPNVTSGTCFQAKTRVCLLYVSDTQTRMIVSCTVEYLKSTWIKMAIDRAVPEGVKAYHQSLEAELLKLKPKPKDTLSPAKTADVKPTQESKIAVPSVQLSAVKSEIIIPESRYVPFIPNSKLWIPVLVFLAIVIFAHIVSVVLLLRLYSMMSEVTSKLATLQKLSNENHPSRSEL